MKPKDFDPLEDSDYEPDGDEELVGESGLSDFGPVSKPGIFLGYRLEPGGQWKGDYYVDADLEHFRNGFTRPSVYQVKRIWRNPEEGYMFPM